MNKAQRLVVAGMSLTAVLPVLSQEAADDPAVQEVVVTGTFIRRSEGFTPASPVAEIAKDDFEAHAPKTVADFLTQLPYSFNTTVRGRPRAGLSNGSAA